MVISRFSLGDISVLDLPRRLLFHRLRRLGLTGVFLFDIFLGFERAENLIVRANGSVITLENPSSSFAGIMGRQSIGRPNLLTAGIAYIFMGICSHTGSRLVLSDLDHLFVFVNLP